MDTTITLPGQSLRWQIQACGQARPVSVKRLNMQIYCIECKITRALPKYPLRDWWANERKDFQNLGHNIWLFAVKNYSFCNHSGRKEIIESDITIIHRTQRKEINAFSTNHKSPKRLSNKQVPTWKVILSKTQKKTEDCSSNGTIAPGTKKRIKFMQKKLDTKKERKNLPAWPTNKFVNAVVYHLTNSIF